MRIVLGSYMVRYPMGGMISYVLQYLDGLSQLGHDVYFVEKSGYPDSCFDPARGIMTSDCAYGVSAATAAMERIGLSNRLSYVDEAGEYHGLPQARIEEVFRTADLYIEMGTGEAWQDESAWAGGRVMIDGDPGFTQIWMLMRRERGETIPEYDACFTVGSQVASGESLAPAAGVKWHHTYHPVSTRRFTSESAPDNGSFTTVMNWESYGTVEYNSVEYGHKNLEFEKFFDLPLRSPVSLEAAIAGHRVPYDRLRASGWRITNAHEATLSVDSFHDYIRGSRGEFTVCKNGFVALRTGWFGDRSSAYLASGRPVVAQDTGFSRNLPCGRGLFAVNDCADAAAALEEIEADYAMHSKAAREIAAEFLDASAVMQRILDTI